MNKMENIPIDSNPSSDEEAARKPKKTIPVLFKNRNVYADTSASVPNIKREIKREDSDTEPDTEATEDRKEIKQEPQDIKPIKIE